MSPGVIRVLGIIGILLPTTLAAAVLAALVHFSGLASRLGPAGWIALAPALYFAWLVLLSIFSALTLRHLGRRASKPARLVIRQSERLSPDALLLVLCYQRAVLLASLPLAAVLARSPGMQRLVLSAYAPRVSVGRRLQLYGHVLDPDLTDIGDDVIIGDRATVVAHAVSATSDGDFTFASARIRLGDRVSIGGGALVQMGCTLGDDAVVEANSNVLPFTTIPAGEVWGGQPAVFRRLRSAATCAPGAASEAGLAGEHVQAAQRLVAEALGMPLDRVPADASRATLAEWDSLGQVAIAAALHDRLSRGPQGDEVFRLSSVADVARVLASPVMPPAARPAAADAVALPEDPEWIPLMDHAEATRLLAARADASAETSRDETTAVAIRVVSTFVAEPIAGTLRLWARAFGVAAEVEFASYGQVEQELLDPAGPLRAEKGPIGVVLARPEDLMGEQAGSARAEAILRVVESCAAAASARGRPLVVGTLPPVLAGSATADAGAAAGLRAAWIERIEKVPGVEILDVAGIVEAMGTEAAADPRLDAIARIPFSGRASREIGIGIARILRRRRLPAAKVLALDCDGVLWGGVVGEDGLDGIVLGPEGPGRAFQLVQRRAQELARRGVLLALVSRNEERDAWEVFDRHPGMILRREDVAAWRIGWNAKSQSLRELAAELRLGLDSFVLLDDDPAVRAEVRSNASGVHVIPGADDPAAAARALSQAWLFDAPPATAEDAQRTSMMREERDREELRSQLDLDAWLAELDLEVEIAVATADDVPRLSQLTQRTNQFNLSLRRRSPEEIRALLGSSRVLGLRARDRFGDYGLVGACVLRPEGREAELDTLLMSCRALGRGIEQAFLHVIAREALSLGASTLVAPVVEGPRNEPARRFAQASGFTERAPGTLALPLPDEPALPPHVRLRWPVPIGG